MRDAPPYEGPRACRVGTAPTKVRPRSICRGFSCRLPVYWPVERVKPLARCSATRSPRSERPEVGAGQRSDRIALGRWIFTPSDVSVAHGIVSRERSNGSRRSAGGVDSRGGPSCGANGSRRSPCTIGASLASGVRRATRNGSRRSGEITRRVEACIVSARNGTGRRSSACSDGEGSALASSLRGAADPAANVADKTSAPQHAMRGRGYTPPRHSGTGAGAGTFTGCSTRAGR